MAKTVCISRTYLIHTSRDVSRNSFKIVKSSKNFLHEYILNKTFGFPEYVLLGWMSRLFGVALMLFWSKNR